MSDILSHCIDQFSFRLHRADMAKKDHEIDYLNEQISTNTKEYEELLKVKGRLSIGATNPKKFTFGSVIQDASAIGEDTEFTFCVFKVAVGKSYCSKLESGMELGELQLKEGFDSVYFEDARELALLLELLDARDDRRRLHLELRA